MTTGGSPYVSPAPVNTSGSATTLETTIYAQHGMVDIGGVMAHAETFNGQIPGPTLMLNQNDTAIVRLVNLMDHPTGIHWHGIELSNSADGVEVTQEAVIPAFTTPPPAPAPAGGTYLYKFKVPRPGIYWYHPHHHHSLNRVFRGMYGMIVVRDPNEPALIASGVLPPAANTRQIVLSDITVCDAPGSNDAATYPNPTTQPQPAEWLSGQTSQGGPTPRALCEVPPTGSATDDHGHPAAASYGAGDVPSISRTGQTNEGQTVLTNGVDVGARGGTPASPGTLAAGAHQLNVTPGTGLRLQIANCATIRYFRLRLTDAAGAQIPLIRVGGEGGLLDNAVSEGGVVGGYDTKYGAGEILLPAGSRADVVAAIPATATGTLTLWTRDFQRTGPGPMNPNNWARLPTVPVMHLNVTGSAPSTPYTIGAGTPLRASIAGAAVDNLGGATTSSLLDPTDPGVFTPTQPGSPNPEIQITTTPPSFDTVMGNFEGFTPYSSAPHIMSSRWAEQGDVLELLVNNTTAAHHPFHLHGFSIQPISLTGPASTYTWPYREFRDNVDIPANNVLTFRVRLDDRELKDGMTLGGALGRWLFHCHIFFHHHQGMISELVVSSPNGTERPHVDVRGSWAYTPAGGTAQRFGTYWRRGGGAVTLSASVGNVVDTGGGTWQWTYNTMGVPAGVQYVYITGEAAGLRDQAVFRLKIGAPDDGADNGDPHVHTVDGKYYDFQGAGEFTLLRDWEGMEVQARHWPVTTASPITDPYTGLKTCVSVNTAVAARVGDHRISYQTGREGRELELFIDGEPSSLPREGMDVRGGHRISAYEVANGQMGLRVDYASQAVLTATPWFWSTYGIWLFNVNVSHTQADEGIMGRIPPGTWLPALPSGETVGPMPSSLHDRYVTLYETFANAWRVTDETSLFAYGPGESTKTYTDERWPPEKPPCVVDPAFEVPGASPPSKGIPLKRAKEVCRAVKADGMNRDCVFDVATTGDEEFAEMYLAEQELRLRTCSVQLIADKAQSRPGEPLDVVATVLPLRHKGPRPTGEVSFLVDDRHVSDPVRLDKTGRASFTIEGLERGEHTIRAAYGGGGRSKHLECSSPPLVHTVEETRKGDRKRDVEPA